jgi:hypothetical protein
MRLWSKSVPTCVEAESTNGRNVRKFMTDPADVSEIDGMISDSVSGQLLVDSAYSMPDSEDLDAIMDDIMKEARNEA